MKKVITICLLVNLVGCATYDSKFACDAPEGVGCRSISEVNEMVNHKEIGAGRGSATEKISSESAEIAYGATPEVNGEVQVIRLPERTMSVLIKSFTDDKGDYIGETKVHTVIEAGGWQEVTR